MQTTSRSTSWFLSMSNSPQESGSTRVMSNPPVWIAHPPHLSQMSGPSVWQSGLGAGSRLPNDETMIKISICKATSKDQGNSVSWRLHCAVWLPSEGAQSSHSLLMPARLGRNWNAPKLTLQQCVSTPLSSGILARTNGRHLDLWQPPLC